MKYTGYRLNFTTAVHIGRRNLEDAEHMIYADTLFSALCHEALQQGGQTLLSQLVDLVMGYGLRISDALPFHGDVYYIPRPMMAVETEKDGDSQIKKKLKKLECLPAQQLEDYLRGRMDIAEESEIYSHMGSSEIRTMASVQEAEDTVPFSVGAYRFSENWGLYVIIAYEEESVRELIENLLTGLGFSGIGGKRSAGLGKFILENANLPESLVQSLRCSSLEKTGNYMTLSISMAEDEALEQTLAGASYSIVRRSGFISSESYGDRLLKKQDAYLFKAGSVFQRTFEGTVLDVSGRGGHPVYRYAKPIFLEVE